MLLTLRIIHLAVIVMRSVCVCTCFFRLSKLKLVQFKNPHIAVIYLIQPVCALLLP